MGIGVEVKWVELTETYWHTVKLAFHVQSGNDWAEVVREFIIRGGELVAVEPWTNIGKPELAEAFLRSIGEYVSVQVEPLYQGTARVTLSVDGMRPIERELPLDWVEVDGEIVWMTSPEEFALKVLEV